MTEMLEIGPVPAEEECAQVGDEDYHWRAKEECTRFMDLIRKTVGFEPRGAKLLIQWSRHDFGSYAEVVVSFDPEMPEALAYALKVEADAPTSWPPKTQLALPL